MKKLREAEGVPLTKSKRKIKRRYSITGDLISYSLCPRQYGFYRFLGYAPSNPSQEWYGSIIHRFLKRAHTYFRLKGEVPDEDEIERIFRQIEVSMELEGARPFNEAVRKSALKVIEAFCRIEGKEFFESIVEAELPLMKELDDFILYGVVDALKMDGNSVEIWDYKGMRRPDENTEFGRKKIERYRKQMFVYGYLYRERTGEYPRKAVLYFLNEIKGRNSRPPEALLVVDFELEETQKQVEEFINEFCQVVRGIEESKERNKWALPETIDEATCSQCDFRFDCPKWLERDYIFG